MKSYKYKLRRPSKHFILECERVLSGCAELYNASLQERRDAWRVNRVAVSFYDQVRQIPAIRQERGDIGSLYSSVLEDPLARVKRAFDGFFRRVKQGKKPGYPRFKSRAAYDSFVYRRYGYKVVGDKLILSKLGSCRLHLSRPIEGNIKTVTIRREADGWYAIFAVVENQSRWFPRTGDSVGVDVGIENFTTLSTGEVIENPQYLHVAERRIKTAQRNVSRKTLRGTNRRKAVTLLAKQHLKVARQRQDFFHKTSLNLIKEFDAFAFENLNIAGMAKNHHLAKSISDAAWDTFLKIHTSKAENAGRVVGFVNPAYTSQDCSRCGNRVRKSLAVREHRCIECGLVLHRDHNAAINIKGRADLVGMGTVALPSELRIAS